MMTKEEVLKQMDLLVRNKIKKPVAKVFLELSNKDEQAVSEKQTEQNETPLPSSLEEHYRRVKAFEKSDLINKTGIHDYSTVKWALETDLKPEERVNFEFLLDNSPQMLMGYL